MVLVRSEHRALGKSFADEVFILDDARPYKNGRLFFQRVEIHGGRQSPGGHEFTHLGFRFRPLRISRTVAFRILRQGTGMEVLVPQPDPEFRVEGSFGWLGAYLGTEFLDEDLGGALAYGAGEVSRNTRMITESGKLLVTGAVGLRQVAGPVEIARMSERAYRMNWRQFFAFVAFLSLNLAILNFLPIPVLDGGHFMLLAVEGVIRRPLPATAVRYTNLAGATVVVFFMGFAFLNDLLRLLGL